jgi:hypothetical protein
MSSASKLKNVELSDGWSFVTRSKGSQRAGKKKPGAKPPTKPQHAPVNAKQVSVLRDEILASLKSFEELKGTSNLTLSLLRATRETPLTTASCLGLGPLASGPSANRRRSIAQLAGYMWLTNNIVVSPEQNALDSHVIDPNFSSTDEVVFDHFGMKMHLELQHAVSGALEGSFCYSPYLPWPVLLLDYLSAGRIKPLILVCQDLTSMKDNLEMRSKQIMKGESINVDGRECSKDDLVKAVEACDVLLKDYRGTKFPVYEPLPFAFQDLLLYIRAG